MIVFRVDVFGIEKAEIWGKALPVREAVKPRSTEATKSARAK